MNYFLEKIESKIYFSDLNLKIKKHVYIIFLLTKLKDEHGAPYASLIGINVWLITLNLIIGILIMTFIVLPQHIYNADAGEFSFNEIEELDIDKICSDLNINRETTTTTAVTTTSDLSETTTSIDENGYESTTMEDRRLYQRNQNSLAVTKCCTTIYKNYLENATSTENKELGQIVLDVILGTVIILNFVVFVVDAVLIKQNNFDRMI